ncbi:MAG: glutathione S-transferase family protein [Xanthomonadaceae bacterium]|nr:glutathione S-transferase family protein [Xanthomonadaceae bacterium]
MSPTLEIIGRRSSHYTRMVRLLAEELGVNYALRPIHDLLSEDPAVFAGNPALKLPAARLGETTVWGSLNACRLVARSTPGGETRVFWPEQAQSALLMNAHEVLAHVMAAQVEVVFHEIVSRRPADATSRKRRTSLMLCLEWLNRHLDDIHAALPADRIALFDLGLYALLEHLPFRNPIDLSPMPHLVDFVAAFGERASAQATPYVFDAPPPERADA